MELEELLCAAADEQPGAWKRLMPTLERRLLRLFRQSFAEPDAEELSQATMAIIEKQIPGFVPRVTFCAWTLGIARRVGAKRVGQRCKEKGVEALLAQVDPTANTGPFSWLHKHELLALLREEIERLHPRYRRAVELQLEGCSIKTHARRENISIAAAGVHRHRAHKQLRKQLLARLSESPPSPAPS